MEKEKNNFGNCIYCGLKKCNHTEKIEEKGTSWEEDTVDEMVRDFTQVLPRPKSEVRRRIQNKLIQEREALLKEIVEEVRKIKTAGHDECNEDFMINVLDIIKKKI
jgi:hypothetical protein